uniref:Uncharacterized protein n=1 Tax=Sphaerodactylus townsendi TaxID=933632 RepID=A0ACB8G506_9SAUR
MQLTAAVSFLTILQEESISIHTYTHSLLHIILQNLEHRDAGVSNAWLETLLAAIEALPKETIRHEILNLLVSKAQLSQTLQSRLVSCKILGKLANKFEAHIRSTFVQKKASERAQEYTRQRRYAPRGSFTLPRSVSSPAFGQQKARGRKRKEETDGAVFLLSRVQRPPLTAIAEGREEGPPAPKKKKKEKTAEKPHGSRAPPKGAAVIGQLSCRKHFTTLPAGQREHFRCVGCSPQLQLNVPPAPAERNVDRSNRQVPGPSSDTGGGAEPQQMAGNGATTSSNSAAPAGEDQVPANLALANWQSAPPAAFAELLRAEIEKMSSGLGHGHHHYHDCDRAAGEKKTSVKREILPLVKSLCQDVEYEVRSCMCRQLEHIAQGIGTELTKNVVLPELVELARDEGSSVRLAAFETLVNLLEMFDADDRSQTVLPLVKSFCEKSFKADESILVSLSFHLGKLCNGLYGIFTPEQHLRFLEFYKKLCTLGLEQENGHSDNQVQLQTLEQEKKYISVRKNCAYNLPAMIVFVDPKNFNLELYSTFYCLCHDPEAPVRHTMAIGFYEAAMEKGPPPPTLLVYIPSNIIKVIAQIFNLLSLNWVSH